MRSSQHERAGEAPGSRSWRTARVLFLFTLTSWKQSPTFQKRLASTPAVAFVPPSHRVVLAGARANMQKRHNVLWAERLTRCGQISDDHREGSLSEKLAAAKAELRKAEAFRLPSSEKLKQEVSRLEGRWNDWQKQTAAVAVEQSAPAAKTADLDEGALQALRLSPRANRGNETESEQDKDVFSKLTFDSIMQMSYEERFQLAFDLGPAFTASVAIVALCYWAVCLPITCFAYYETTGEWPQLDQLGIELRSDRTAGTAVGILGSMMAITVLLKPLRLLAAFLITPWTAEHVLPRIPWLDGKPAGRDDPGTDLR
eukprot:TRINITY_DN77763_c0_g1_i1.p1 TRINITY_DN77763_c0_g1~~TRINITY_DN77763_c0_g1_i1.p1  ORF type:complete len:314 (-),score=45.84 TRINITY_DN77763_c0_g1_i1:142-1083(-)